MPFDDIPASSNPYASPQGIDAPSAAPAWDLPLRCLRFAGLAAAGFAAYVALATLLQLAEGRTLEFVLANLRAYQGALCALALAGAEWFPAERLGLGMRIVLSGATMIAAVGGTAAAAGLAGVGMSRDPGDPWYPAWLACAAGLHLGLLALLGRGLAPLGSRPEDMA